MWVPASESHAIERVSLTYVLSEQLPLKFLKSATAYLDEKLSAGEFSAKKTVQFSAVEIGDAGAAPQSPDVVGFSFFAKNNATEEVVRVQKDLAQFSASQYGTWKAFYQDAESCIAQFLEKAIDLTSVRAIKLEYVDRFVYDGDPSSADFSHVINLKGLGVPVAAVQSKMPWHDRRGWFDQVDRGPVLINSDIIVSDVVHRDRPDTPLKSVQILTVVETRFPDPIADVKDLQAVVDVLHTINKSVVASAITEDAAKKVGL